ncbi:MAG: acyl-CoA thioester hydrolase [Solobacterium sp.]|nr:acyl-CoA thioester hydrolase [Solobacterium sp.]
MKGIKFTAEKDGFHGVWYPCPEGSEKGMIVMLGDSSDDLMARTGAKWLHRQGIHVMAMSPAAKDYGHHSYPLERFGKAIAYMKEQGCRKLGIAGASTTGMMALLAASYYPDLTLTVAMSPPDFVMEGFYQDGKDGARERPGDNESSVTWQGKPLPYLPYAYRHPEYWQKIKSDSKAGGDFIASRPLFDESEQKHPIQEEEKIKVERIRGRLIMVGAEDDVLWDTCRYIRRMQERLASLPHTCEYEAWLYEHGTHFVFPESMLKMVLPFGINLIVGLMFKAGKQYPSECRETRIDIDRRLQKAIREW